MELIQNVMAMAMDTDMVIAMVMDTVMDTDLIKRKRDNCYNHIIFIVL